VDFDPDVVQLLRGNAARNKANLTARVLDLTDLKAVETLPSPCHLLCCDLVYHSGASALPLTLLSVLSRDPASRVTLVLVNRFGGAGVAALAGIAGVRGESARPSPTPLDGTVTDGEIAGFMKSAEEAGLRLTRVEVGREVRREVLEELVWWERGKWEMLGIIDDLKIYEVALK